MKLYSTIPRFLWVFLKENGYFDAVNANIDQIVTDLLLEHFEDELEDFEHEQRERKQYNKP